MAGISVAHTRLAVVVLVVLTLVASSAPSAEVATGSIVGTVTESRSQVVPGAQAAIRARVPLVVPGGNAFTGKKPCSMISRSGTGVPAWRKSRTT